MPVSRDRRSRPVDVSTLLPNAQRRANLTVDEPGLRLRTLSSQNVMTGKSSGSARRLRRRSLQAQRTRMRHQRYLNRLPVDQENRSPMTVRSGQGRRSLLPSYYPRTPLRDITAIVRAIERRRAELRDQRDEAPEQEVNAPSSSSQLENETNILAPVLALAAKNMDNVTDENSNVLEMATPQKKLLNSIDKVRQIWVEEQQRVENTPAAKKAERARKVRTLMSMR
ncbi:protein GIGAS CELL1-like [Silene latifolia]|uniref:protein GIGAS CELL1-like n=1 Tax=Silene latifolia TaxID=37657 RepID=UPI003D789D55